MKGSFHYECSKIRMQQSKFHLHPSNGGSRKYTQMDGCRGGVTTYRGWSQSMLITLSTELKFNRVKKVKEEFYRAMIEE